MTRPCRSSSGVIDSAQGLQLDRIWWLVSPQNPLKQHAPKDIAARVARVGLAGHPKIFVSDEETRLGTQYAIDTVRRLKAANPEVRFIWLMGADNLAGLHKWKFWDELMSEIPVAVYPRPGSTLQAGISPAAMRFAPWRKPANAAARFRFAKAPAWIMLDGVLSGLSSSALRHHEGKREY